MSWCEVFRLAYHLLPIKAQVIIFLNNGEENWTKHIYL